MQFKDVLNSPYPYAIFAFAFVGGYYAKGKVIDALFFAWIAQLLLVPAFFAALFGTSLPLGLLHDGFPELKAYLFHPENGFERSVGYVINPVSWAVGITVVAFALICHCERSDRVSPRSNSKAVRRRPAANPMKRPPAAPTHLPMARRS